VFFINHEYVLSIKMVNWLTYKQAYQNNVSVRDTTGIEHAPVFITNNLMPASIITFLRNKMSVINIMYVSAPPFGQELRDDGDALSRGFVVVTSSEAESCSILVLIGPRPHRCHVLPLHRYIFDVIML